MKNKTEGSYVVCDPSVSSYENTINYIMKNKTVTEVGIKFDESKPDYSLIPPFALDEFVKVLTHGKHKYDRDNWKKLEDGKNRYFAAMMRHSWALRRGEELDPDSGLHHTAHIMCCAAFLYELGKI